mgnify:CR=1 FL=1
MTLPDLHDKIALFWERRSFRTKAIIKSVPIHKKELKFLVGYGSLMADNRLI